MVEWRRLVPARRTGERGSPEAAAHLRDGARREKHGDRSGAIEAYRRADAAGSAEGASTLGALLFEAGDVPDAHAALVRADERGSVMGTFRLGFLLQSIGRLDEAEDAYRRAAERGNPHARKNLALLRADRKRAGRRNAAEAEALFAAAEERGIPVLHVQDADELVIGLATVELDQGRPERAEEILREALATGTRKEGAVALSLGILREQRGDQLGADQAYERAVRSDDAEARGAAALNLGLIRGGRGDLPEAERLFRIAVDAGHAEAAVSAALNLGAVLARRGATAEARRYYRMVIESGHRVYGPQAARRLEELR